MNFLSQPPDSGIITVLPRLAPARFKCGWPSLPGTWQWALWNGSGRDGRIVPSLLIVTGRVIAPPFNPSQKMSCARPSHLIGRVTERVLIQGQLTTSESSDPSFPASVPKAGL